MVIWRLNSKNDLLKKLEKEIERTREEMHGIYEKVSCMSSDISLVSTEVVEISQRLDQLLNKYNQEKSRL